MENVKMVERPQTYTREQRRRMVRNNKRRVKKALAGVKEKVALLQDTEINRYLGWMAQWLTREEKEQVVAYGIKLRIKTDEMLASRGLPGKDA